MTRPVLSTIFIVAALMMARPAVAQDTGTPTSTSLSAAYTGKSYSPYARRKFPERPLWGDSHLHTRLSMDAGLFGNRLSPRDAYRFDAAVAPFVILEIGILVFLIAVPGVVTWLPALMKG